MRYSATQYAKIFTSLLEKSGSHHHKVAVKSFVKMLEENGDLKNAGDITYAVEKALYEKSGKVKKETLEAKDHPELIGGLKIRIGDTVVDNSVRSRINNLKSALR